MSMKTLESKRPKKEAHKEKFVSKSKGKVNAERKCSGKVSCIDHNMCPEGYACLLPGFGKGKRKSNKKCFKCNCMEPSQCYFQDKVMLCNCSGSGFTGSYCETNIDDCENATCMNNGSCKDKVNDYSCNCIIGYTGKDCETDIDDCKNTTCMNNGTCTDKVNDYMCHCNPGYIGKNCETDINECENVTCSNNGTCNDGVDSYTCQCSQGYTGTNCETNIDDCENATCMNNGTCNDKVNGYYCNCMTGYMGKNCEIDIDECENTTCMNNSTCNDKVNDYICQCIPGYTGKNCEIDINECENVTCSNKGNCTDGVDSYTCQCSPGFTGINCETSIDLCSSSPCVTNAKCSNLDDGYICTCDPEGPINTNIDLNASSSPKEVCSPGYPSSYPASTGIRWNIIAEDHQKIEIKFTEFVTEYCCDHVLVREGAINETQFCIGVLAGNMFKDTQYYYGSENLDMEYYDAVLSSQLANSFISSANKLSVLFNSNSVITYRGFCFTYLSIS